MILVDLSHKGRRAAALGKLGLSYGIGTVIGSLIVTRLHTSNR